MAFKKITLVAILCDYDQCDRYVEDLVPEEQTRDWPTQFEPSHHRHLEAIGWFITATETLCPTHGAKKKAAAKAEAEHRALIEATHEPLFDLAVTG